MPLIRKIIQVGTARAVSIPKSWLDYYEKESGIKIKEVAIEVNRVLKIEPIIRKLKPNKRRPLNETRLQHS